MTLVQGLFSRAAAHLADLESDPDRGAGILDGYSQRILEEAQRAVGPVLYRLTGPEPAQATPMQYGGFFLERERELLARIKAKAELWLWVDCGPEAYLDFVSDLPADVFAWDAQETGFPLSEMRKLRTSRLCTNEPGADLDLSVLNDIREADRIAV